MKGLYLAIQAVAFIFFVDQSHARSESDLFSYCSEGNCRVISTEFFHQARGMPKDLKFACKNDRHYALTFDDGPSAGYPHILELLDQYKIKASFFTVGSNLVKPENQELLKKAYHSGHYIVNHTLDHKDLTKLSPAEVLEQVESSRNAILKVLGNNPDVEKSARVVRPPFGSISEANQEVFRAHGYISVRWNSDRYDWKLNRDQYSLIVDRIKQQLGFIDEQIQKGIQFNHSILDLNHERQEATYLALKEVIPLLLERGYEFVTLEECLGL